MKTELLWRLLQNEEYAKMTVGEFVKAVKESWFMDEELAFLTDVNWKPTSVTHYTNREA